MERSSWSIIILVALGMAALVLALAPSAWPNPLGGLSPESRRERIPELRTAAAAVDAACREGSSSSFAQVTTASYREGLTRRLDAVEATLTGQTLQAMAAGAPGYEHWFSRPVWATEAAGAYAGVAMPRADGAGAQVLMFAWDGAQFLLDEVRHAVRVTDPDQAAEYLREVLRAR